MYLVLVYQDAYALRNVFTFMWILYGSIDVNLMRMHNSQKLETFCRWFMYLVCVYQDAYALRKVFTFMLILYGNVDVNWDGNA